MMLALVIGLTLSAPAQISNTAGPVTVTKVASPVKALRFEVTIPASRDAVWSAFTTTDGLATWMWRDVRVDLRPGGDWLVLFPGNATGGGTIRSIDPSRRITISALAPERFPTVRAQRTTAVFEFEEVTPASTKVTLVQTGWREGDEWDAAYEYLATGNAQLLGQLRKRFVSGPIEWPKPQ